MSTSSSARALLVVRIRRLGAGEAAHAGEAAQEDDVLVVSGFIGQRCPDLGEQGFAQRQVGQLEPFVRTTRHNPEPRGFGDVDQLLRQPRLADAAPTFDDHHLGVAAHTQVETGAQPVELAPAADERKRAVA